ncbi:MAG: hypothetical protein ABIO63_07945 [Casimicrobiaceae bacterium]
MRIEEFTKEFEKRARARGKALDTLSVADALELMMAFYREVEVTGLAQAPDAALKFSWGVVNRDEGDHFEVNMARVLTTRREAGPPLVRELELTYRFAPTAALRTIALHALWCYSHADLPVFGTQVRETEAFDIAQSDTALSVSLIFADA